MAESICARPEPVPGEASAHNPSMGDSSQPAAAAAGDSSATTPLRGPEGKQQLSSITTPWKKCTPKEQDRLSKRVSRLVEKDPTVKFMLEKLDEAGCPVNPDTFFVCEHGPVAGAFDFEFKEIVLCPKSLISDDSLRDTMTHELIHAFDACRAHVEPLNMKHLACTEIRAANLSGDCRFWNEFDRGNIGLAEQHQRCVRRRAAKSIMAVLRVTREEAHEAVDSVYDTCFNDFDPFDRIP
eukprot:m.8036 g.8036  ORF g.8036 m.8036 type:complete len:239 (+) comp5312_c0_seq2:275-991(+)